MHADPTAAGRPPLAPPGHPGAYQQGVQTGVPGQAQTGPQTGGWAQGQPMHAQVHAPAAHYQAPAAPPRTAYAITGAYMPSGDPGIDRMVALERALKQYGSPF